MQKQYQIVINAPLEKVFDCVNEESQIRRWMDGKLKTYFQNHKDPENPVGAKFTHRVAGLLEWQGEVIAFQKPLLLGIGQKWGILSGTLFYRLVDLAGQSTRLICDLEISEATAPQKILVKAMFPVFNKILSDHLAALKVLSETEQI